MTDARNKKLPMLLLGMDVVGLYVLLEFFHYMRKGGWFELWSWPAWVVIVLMVATMYIFDVYRIEVPATKSRLSLDTWLSVVVGGLIITVMIYALGRDTYISLYGRGILPLSLIAFSFWAAWTRYLLSRRNERAYLSARWLCVADAAPLAYFLKEFSKRQHYGKLSVLCKQKPKIDTKMQAVNWLKETNTAKELAKPWTGIILASNESLDEASLSALMNQRLKGAPIYSLSEYFEQFWLKVPVMQLKDNWFIQASGFNLLHDKMGLKLKRLVDIMLSLVLLWLLLPIIVLIFIFVKISSKGGAIYEQERVGLNSKRFILYKFRTMKHDAEQDGARWADKNDKRVTKVGRFLRKSRLDELPQFWNVLKGDMSFIGPRPERPEFVTILEQRVPYYDLRHLVTPGISGWAQVMYPYGSSVEDAISKLEYDLYYIKNHSIVLDLAIFLKTIRIIIWAKGQ